MAELTVLGYHPGKSLLHQLDARTKLFLLFLINFLALQSSISKVLSLVAIALLMLFWQRISFKKIFQQTRFFYLLLLFVIFSRSLAMEGDGFIEVLGFTFSKTGFISGADYSCRLVAVLFFSILFIFSTKSSDIKAAVQWFLKPIPLIPEKRVGIMISLMIRFLPLVMEQSREISDAQKTRGIELVKNPIKRLSLFTTSLMKGVFKTADKMVLAMEARSYSETRTDPALKAGRFDFFTILLWVLIFAVFVIF